MSSWKDIHSTVFAKGQWSCYSSPCGDTLFNSYVLFTPVIQMRIPRLKQTLIYPSHTIQKSQTSRFVLPNSRAKHSGSLGTGLPLKARVYLLLVTPSLGQPQEDWSQVP